MQINIEKRHLFIILALIVFLAGVILVIAVNPSSKPNPGHYSQEVMVNIPDIGDKSLQEAIDQGLIGNTVKYKAGRYTGNGVNDRVISGVGFTPKSVIIFPMFQIDNCDEWTVRTIDMSGTESPDSQGQQSQGILSLESDGFKISSSCNVNGNTRVYSYITWTW